jgi:hypothetical protein
MHDSFTSFGGMVLLVNMLLGELVFGGLGTGLYGMVMAAAIVVFLAGLMVGRTPEYLGKKIGPAENKIIMLYALAAPLVVLPLTAIAVGTRAGLSGLTINGGPHGLTEILFAYTSCFANNGQSFAGLSANTPFYNLATAFAMMVGRFGLAIPALALAALFGRQRREVPLLRRELFRPILFVRNPAHNRFDHDGGSELSSCLSPRSRTGTIALRKIEHLNYPNKLTRRDQRDAMAIAQAFCNICQRKVSANTILTDDERTSAST